ncbi:low molecular weight protein-tyrosine-phosphatase [Subtercola frigoramans]|uniref:protein-tyrosine-phosphatase n=1 Tax=Subtercola frigoramans TaxID=120298 RepID=A0ABS2KZZ9_9MICO|nr:low molecular weight protein-tyrosine-phosphatase [Subtercola frigoramans]MBM7470400.1 protein-tyrosine phosphatase [Subtercola frigoramans]
MPADRPTDASGVFRVCMVCTGNICRSPMAEVVLRRLAFDAGLADRIAVSSAGTGEWHVGEKADPRTVSSLEKSGYDGADHRARQFDPGWFDDLDLVIVLDRSHERVVRAWATTDSDRSKIRLLSSFDPDSGPLIDVPDPYYSTDALFDEVLQIITRACIALFAQLEPALRHTPASFTALYTDTDSKV